MAATVTDGWPHLSGVWCQTLRRTILRRISNGINYIGACCGSVASHIREMARVLGKLPAEQRPWTLNYEKPMSAYEYYDHDPTQVSADDVVQKAPK